MSSCNLNILTLFQQLLKLFWLAHWTEGEVQKGIAKEANESLALLEEKLRGKRFFGGDTVSYLDVVYGWLGPYLSVIEEVTGVTVVDESEFPAIRQWEKEYKSCEALKPCMPDRDKLVAYFTESKEMYKMYANAWAAQQ
jgi:glutathione S-transferase